MSDLRFQKLTPTSNVDLNVYEEGFEFIFSNDDIRNIAVSGPYSSGKSSLLESYKKKYPQKTFIHISLAHFTNENKDNEEKEIEDSETVIEGKILNQLIQQIPIENIPQSNFRIKRTTGTNYNGYWAMGIVAFIGMLLFVLNYGKYCTWINEMNSAVWNYEWLRKFMFFLASPFGWVLSVLCIVVIACLGLYNLLNIQTNKNIFKKISVQGNEIEIFEDSQNSYFDKYLNEVLYLFENSKADVIVFEDIDRFENVQIFERLREINMLTNCRLQQHEEEEKVLRFFYLLKDDIFITKDRAKFFDYILPVVPVLDSSNSYNKIKEFFVESTVEEKLNDRFLKGLALYIDDIRVLKNIYNEFVIYYERLKKIDLDPNRMLALVTYKNLFPRDFADLQLNKGFVHAIFSNKEKFCCKEIERINNEIQELEERIKNSEDELAVSLEELDDIRAAKYERADDGNYWHNIDKTFLKWEKEQLPIRKQAVEDRAIDTQQLLEKQLKELKKQKKRISGRSISQIINQDNIDMIFQITTTNELGDVTDYNQIKKSEYFNLLKYLIRNGYIDESYSDYMTYFYENSLTLNDKTFLRSVNDKKAKEYSYNLDSPLLVVSNLIPEDFLQEETLNFDLLRQCYPDCVLHFIEKNLREYCEIMSQKYIEIDEVEEILTWDILKIEDAKQLIDILPTTLKVIDHDYSDDIIAYILGECFSEDEFIPLLEKFFLYSAKVQNAIIELSDSRMNKVVESMENIDFNILKKILTSDNIQHTNKVILLCEIIKKYKPDRIKEALIIAGYEEVSKLLDNKTRPRISANNEHKQLLNALKDNRFIISYEFNEKSGIYSYTRSTKKRNDLPPEFL